ncbi:dienelactone hydrolase family protein [Polymorphobacter sp.]|uniref:dienelactone hydrolase family protein n=1 Tax=Polymorphobacter sp. TaxID=1909290 RepID=UPI003F7019B7
MHITQQMIDLYDQYTHTGSLSRRELIARLGGVAALALIEARATAVPKVAATDARITAAPRTIPLPGGRSMKGYLAQPRTGAAEAPRVLVIHENRGLNEHTMDVARRFAAAGVVAFAADFLTPAGGTPTDEDKARDMIGALDRPATIADGVGTLKWLGSEAPGRGVACAVGFCWGGGMVNDLAVNAGDALRVGVAYYGAPAADLAAVPAIKARLVLHYAGLDTRINAMAPPYQDALTAAEVPFAAYVYEGANHAFNNDTSEARYNEAAANLAWSRTLAALKI